MNDKKKFPLDNAAELSDADLENVSGGASNTPECFTAVELILAYAQVGNCCACPLRWSCKNREKTHSSNSGGTEYFFN